MELGEGEEQQKNASKVVVSKNLADLQRLKIEKLMKNPDKLAYIPDKGKEKIPRAFNPPEFVRNIWGSSAGAGSGDFHVYRGVRRRENIRQKYLEAKEKEETLNKRYLEKLENNRLEAEARTAKKRQKRFFLILVLYIYI
ncbi:hypothetical protein HELRODRAFT_85027 [Helobdella robusta]|uniref:PRKR-interacting protein 1 homolog n=1 Tax=Helobdella robusta TaxID=6412 RepID=T1G5R5_HELRO|nr:hypothetical protein HELRODRAFT_85027 [Helobdella robusta]ESN97918.1 hypothetical protein HELRODRAFT_85027 [Helobdella robusta]